MNAHRLTKPCLGALVCVLGFGTSAHAGTLTTPSLLYGPTGNGDITCAFLNAGKKSASEVTIEIRDGFGSVAGSTSIPEVASGNVRTRSEFSPQNGANYYCVVSGKGVSKGNSRVTLCNRSGTDFTPTACVTAP